MSETFDRRTLLRRGSVIVPAVSLPLIGLVGAPAGAGSAAATGDAGMLARPLGTWEVTVTFPGNPDQPSERGLFAFAADGLAMETNSGSNTLGLGSWRPVDDTHFRFGFRHQAFDENGQMIFEVRIRQEATVTGPDSFVSDGTGSAYSLDGQLLFTVHTHGEAVRYRIDDV
ncbi:MAG TPA: hypothetical protein VF163_07105 [Micromonosporaceae bacterium]